MDRSTASVPEHSTAVRTAGSAPLNLLLPAAAGECREPASAPRTRRTVSEMPLLRQPQDGRHAGGEPQTRPAPDAHFGHRSAVSQTELEPPASTWLIRSVGLICEANGGHHSHSPPGG